MKQNNILKLLSIFALSNQIQKMILRILTALLLLCGVSSSAQQHYDKRPITIVDEQANNRLLIYALNNTLTDYDVAIELRGTGFRQRGTSNRMVRVPARSKVNLLNLVIERDQTPQYTYNLQINDSLSRRSLMREFELIKIYPPEPINIYIPDNCSNCESLLSDLEESPFIFKKFLLSENESIRNQLSPAVRASGFEIDTITNSIVMIGGKMYLEIENYEDLTAKMEE
jgi:hypothetical protein